MTEQRLARARRFAVWSAVPPLSWLYKAVYRALIAGVTWGLRRRPEVLAIYLQRGCAKGEIQPGISDIDMAVVLRPGLERPDRPWWAQRFEHELPWYRSVARCTHLLDPALRTYREDRILEILRTRYNWQYRFTEGKQTWRLLYGRDYIAELPDLSVAEMSGGLHNELQNWWRLIATRFFQPRPHNQEPLTRNVACYKAIREVLRATAAMRCGGLAFRRGEALKFAGPYIDAETQALIDRTGRLARRRFLPRDEPLVEDTAMWMLRFLDRFYGELLDHPFSAAIGAASVEVDCPPEELLRPCGEQEHVERLLTHLDDEWGGVAQGAYFVPSIASGIDEMLLLIRVQPERLPTLEQLWTLNALHRDGQSALRRRITLHLLLPHAAFLIGLERVGVSWETVLSPACLPDVFALLARPAFALRGEPLRHEMAPAWTGHVRQFCWAEQLRYRQLLETRPAEGWDSTEFLRISWKCLQLIAMNRGVSSGRVRYPLTLAAIRRALAETGIPLPQELEPFDAASWRALNGEAVDIGRLLPLVVAFVREIDPGGDRFVWPPRWPTPR